MSLLKTNEIQNYNGSSLTLTASTVSTSAQLNTGGNISVTGSLNVSDDSTTRTNLGLGTIATQAADNVAITGGNISGITAYPGRNRLINGSFQIAQRNTSFSGGTDNADDTYTLDRWYVLSEGNDSIDVTQQSDSPDSNGKSIRLDVETTGEKFGIAQIIEGQNCIGAIGNTCTLSFYAKVSNARIDTVKAAIIAWSGTEDTVTSDIISAWNADGTTPTLIANATFENTPADLSVTTSWARYELSANIDTASTKNIIIFIWSDDATNPQAGDFLYLTNIQFEAATSVATPFEHRPIGTELALCQRYFETNRGDGWDQLATGMNTGVYYNNNAFSLNTFFSFPIQFNTVKRASPSVKIYATYSGNVDKVSTNYNTNTDADSTVTVVTKNGFSGGVQASPGGSFNVIDFNWTAESEL